MLPPGFPGSIPDANRDAFGGKVRIRLPPFLSATVPFGNSRKDVSAGERASFRIGNHYPRAGKAPRGTLPIIAQNTPIPAAKI